ncbi:GNAT family N-acetyltransferase [Dokdonella sp.]|uniref:GNAT family N-acetyltransferase n=1 Tax=Dokdonella sp. TaxID=2291710 RepID=UPI0026267628|nr:GNAT family N-acetyltransferase [Dokdonella sp.]
MTMKPARSQSSRIWTERLRDGLVVQVRPLLPQDCNRERAFLAHLPEENLAQRFVGLVKPIDEAVVRDLTCPAPECEATIGAFVPVEGGEIEVGVAAYVTRPDGVHCDCTVTVDPDWQKLGVGRVLMKHLIEIAREHGIRRMYAMTECHTGAHALGEYLGFHSRPDPEDPHVTTFELVLH